MRSCGLVTLSTLVLVTWGLVWLTWFKDSDAR
jgi:hypothetical protein